MLKIHPVHAGNFKLDGGAMFGVVPKTIWSRSNPADENNMCDWSMRCLIVETDDRLILVDSGIGDKQSDKFFSFYYLSGETDIRQAVKNSGFNPEDITDVFFTHLHFDHCGGAVINNNGTFELAFPNAQHWSNSNHWKWATEPNAREKASFLKENILPIQESGKLNFFDKEGEWIPGFEVYHFNGHTDAQMIPHLKVGDKTVVFMADLLPSVGHIPLAYVMGYDTRPLLTLEEKERFLNQAADENFILFLEHDSENECCTVKHTEKGVRLDQKGKLSEFL